MVTDGATVAMFSEPTAVPFPKGQFVGDTQRDRGASRGEQAEAAEREAAKQRILAQAEAERIPVEETTRAVPDRRWRRER
ncbi:hypothetical protein ABZ671_27930 [Micromonospora sp. NPDC006766]|uniref:hypothetical protein n=1 Tax=Micromonospora sp. NPDC006766 TaxID=3154778 RepID=UPI0033F3618B